MRQNRYLFLLFVLMTLTGCGGTQKKLTSYVNPFWERLPCGNPKTWDMYAR